MACRADVVETIRTELGESEGTEQMVDWLLDVWETVDLLIARFGSEQARAIVLASAVLEEEVKEVVVAGHRGLRQKEQAADG